MAQKETSHIQNSHNSALSADAKSFIPRHTASSSVSLAGGTNTQSMTADDKSLTQHQLSQLPRYMTSCYPFVKNDSSGSVRAASPGGWHGPNRPRAAGRGKQQRQNTSSSIGSFGVNPRYPIPQALMTPRQNVRNPVRGLLPNPGAILPGHGSISQTSTGMGYQVPGNIGALSPGQPPINPCAPCINSVTLPLGQPAVWPTQLAASYPALYPGGTPLIYAPSQCSRQDWNISGEGRKSSDRKKKKAELGNNMISIGIQNESGVQHGSGSNSKRKPKTKTIICRNADTQTDFSDEIANLTLAEKPCPLYQKDAHSRSWLQHYNQDSSTDSEEKDSDSGYSSPQHRRNQANNGTHPIVGITPYIIPGVPTTLTLQPPPHPGPGLLPQPPNLHTPFVPTSLGPCNGYIQTGGLMAPAISCYQHNYQPVPSEVNALIQPGLQPDKRDATPSLAASNAAASLNAMSQSTCNPGVSQGHGVNVELDDSETSSGKRRRHRSRRKNRASSGDDVSALSDDPYSMHSAHSSSNVSRTSMTENDLTLHFDDEDEFPNLLSAAGGLPSSTNSQSSGPISYSDILKNQTSLSQESSVSGIERFRYGGGSETQSTSSSTGKESKNARKRRKRREMASRAADEELAEICLEQTVLKELRSKSHLSDVTKQETTTSKGTSSTTPPANNKPQPAGKKSKQPISLNFADMITALEKQQEDTKSKKEKRPVINQPVNKQMSHVPTVNPLDTSAPVKRGKEREAPKVKKPSPLKKVILKEREEKKRLRLLEDANPLSPSTESSGSSQLVSVAGLPLDSDLSQEAAGSKAGSVDFMGTPVSAEMSPISQTSPISMSPLSGSPLSSGVNSPIASNTIIGSTPKSSVLMKIHSRRFREYCNQVLDKNIDECCTQLLQDLVRFQDRLYHKDPTKAKAKRRIVLGLREVTKHLKLNRIKCVIISPNMERIQSKGGLDEALNNILDLCTNQDVPFVFALGRRALGRACAKLVPVSVAGIFNYEGSEENFKKLMTLSEKARNAYKEMVTLLEQEMEQQPHAATNPSTTASTTSFSHLFAHLGHSRTPSACSAISFTSSILSEPISENYPHSEPETDSRGYEIVANNPEGDNTGKEQMSSEQVADNDEEDVASNGLQSSAQEKVVIVESLDDIGHEADNEADDDDIISNPRKKASVSCAGVMEKDEGPCDVSDVDSEPEGSLANSVIEKDHVDDLPHIDSIHSVAVDMNTEILSQHSSKTLDLNAEVLSTHSSKTLEAERCGHATPERPPKNHGSAADLHEASPVGSGNSSRLRLVDNQERVQSWVVDSQKHLNLIGQCPDMLDDHITNNNTNGGDAAKCCSIKDGLATSGELSEADGSCSPCINVQSVIAGVDKLAVVNNEECGTDASCNGTDPPIT